MNRPIRCSRPFAFSVVAMVVFSAACAPKEAQTTDSANAMMPMSSASDSAGMMPGMAMGSMDMTGDADHDFLRMMTDHHKGLIQMAHETIESKDNLSVKSVAERLDNEQDAEMDQMMTMLEKTYKDPYTPKITAENQLLIDQLKGKTGKDYDSTFLNNVITHHEQSRMMIDAYLPTAKNAELKAMAEKMKAVQSAEITEFKAKVGK